MATFQFIVLIVGACSAAPLVPTSTLGYSSRYGLEKAKGVPIANAPTLGYNSWYGLGKAKGWPITNASVIKATADALMSTGLAALGYTTLVVDDSWQAKTYSSATAGLQADPIKFPGGGMADVAKYVIGKGLTLGLYTTPGEYTCSGEGTGPDAGRRGSMGHTKANAELWVGEWGVGYIKDCVCNTTAALRTHAYRDMRAAIDAVLVAGGGVAKVASVAYECDNFMDKPWDSPERTQCNIISVSDDVPDDFAGWTAGLDLAVDQDAMRRTGGAYPHPSGGRWASFDYLQVGGAQSLAEYRAQMSVFAILAAPIFIGTDLRSIKSDVLAVYAAPEVLAVSQDALAIPGVRLWQEKSTGTEAWAREIADKGGQRRSAILLLNRSPIARPLNVVWSALNRSSASSASFSNVTLRDCWARAAIPGMFGTHYEAIVPSHEALLLVATSSV